MAPRVGLEPTTYRLTAGRSTIELSGNKSLLHYYCMKYIQFCKYPFIQARHRFVLTWPKPVCAVGTLCTDGVG